MLRGRIFAKLEHVPKNHDLATVPGNRSHGIKALVHGYRRSVIRIVNDDAVLYAFDQFHSAVLRFVIPQRLDDFYRIKPQSDAYRRRAERRACVLNPDDAINGNRQTAVTVSQPETHAYRLFKSPPFFRSDAKCARAKGRD